MATSFEDTPKWFNADFYLESKLANLIIEDPKGNWTRPSLLEAFKAAGFDNPYDHYVDFGDKEGLSPNPLFNSTEYLAAKTAQLGSTWTPEMVAEAIDKAGMTLMQHYEKFGSAEGLSPSSDFNQDKYYDAKLDQLQTTEPDKGWTLDTLKAAFAAAGLTPLDHYLEYAKAENLDKFDYSDNGAPIPHPGNKITLTTGADTATPDATVEGFKTSSRDDVISGVVSGSKSTLNAGDVIDGGAGVDTLKVDMKGGNFAFGSKGGSVKNVEYVELANADGKIFDAKGVENVTAYTVDSAKGTVTINNVDSADTDYVLTKEAGGLNVAIADAALAGKTDNVSVKLKGVGQDVDAGGDVAINVKGVSAAGKLETLTLVAEGANSYVTVANNHDTVAVEGAGNIEIASVGAALKAFDASAATGKVDADLSAAAAGLKTITGGAGDDIIVVGAPATGATFAGGDGNDTLVFNSLASGSAVKATISGFETFLFDDNVSGAAAITVNATAITDVETIQYAGISTADDTLTITGASAWNELTFAINDEVGASSGSFTYDGTGVLNISAYGDTSGAASFAKVTATAVDTVNISNTSDGDFTLTALAANKATTLNVNTGDDAFTYAGTSDALAALQYVNLAGAGNTSITLGSGSKALEEVNANDLTGDLTLTLTNVATSKGVIVNMGDYGATSLTGTAKADTFNLGGGSEKVVLIANDAANLADHITNFGSNDKIGGTIAGASAFTAVEGLTKTAFAAKVFAFGGDVEDAKAITKDNVSTYLSAGSATGYAAFTDANNSVAIYKIVASASTFSSVQLMGVLDNFEIADLAGANFVL